MCDLRLPLPLAHNTDMNADIHDIAVIELPADMISTREAARLMGVTSNTVIRWIRAGDIKPAWRLGREYRVSRSAVLRFVKPVQVPLSEPRRASAEASRPVDVVVAEAKSKGIL